jgi:predicted transcriptional regulator
MPDEKFWTSSRVKRLQAMLGDGATHLEIADSFGISRSAVTKFITALKAGELHGKEGSDGRARSQRKD